MSGKSQDQMLWEESVAKSRARSADTESVAKTAKLVEDFVASQNESSDGHSAKPVKERSSWLAKLILG